MQVNKIIRSIICSTCKYRPLITLKCKLLLNIFKGGQETCKSSGIVWRTWMSTMVSLRTRVPSLLARLLLDSVFRTTVSLRRSFNRLFKYSWLYWFSYRSDYFPLGTVTEFRYSQEISRVFSGNDLLKWLNSFGEGWGFWPTKYALTFVDNHGKIYKVNKIAFWY